MPASRCVCDSPLPKVPIVTYQARYRLIHADPAAVAEVYWTTHAGGGTNTLVHRMRTLTQPPPVDVYSPWMPVREENAEVSFDGNLCAMAEVLAERLIADRNERSSTAPVVLIGHSFGAALAYRMAGHLIAADVIPHRLVALSAVAPDALQYDQKLHLLSDEELIRQVDELFGGIPDYIRQDREAQSFFAAALRADLALLESYQHDRDEPPLTIPIMAICGTDDRAIDLSQMQRWQQMTSGQFRLRALPGDHFFPLSRMAEILNAATWDLRRGDR